MIYNAGGSFDPPTHYTTNNYIANLYVTWPEKTSLMCAIKYFKKCQF